LEDSAFSFYELLIEATRSTKRKRQLLIHADVELEKLRLFVRMSQRRKLTSISQYHFASGVLVELGKLLWWMAGDTLRWMQMSFLERLWRGGGGIMLAAAVYFVVLFLLGLRQHHLRSARS
jgi:peptidoglycan biosynthesis protein MviN/MurJ (putative lipid II flippase)